ncbi:uncharacterized protein DFL_003404 [Arthrobotrys flagrans]|uniref:Uncharacterized protein n=1 Tax=Arthrobotrys flagrans TaxID=97331 RepID=A0A437A1P7_ARTFL|nr:hypothetical protein DFL_003404 [Arthrobotrys flagrans]
MDLCTSKRAGRGSSIVAAAFTKEPSRYVRRGDIGKERPMREILDQLSDDIKTIKSKLNKKEDIEIFNRLTPIDLDGQQTDYFNRRQPRTGRWLLDSTEYQDWLKSCMNVIIAIGIQRAHRLKRS